MISTDTEANVIQGVSGSHPAGREANGARSVALGALAIYLVLSGVVLGVRGHVALAGVHAAAVMVALWAQASRNTASRMVGDIMPLVVAAVLYSEIPLMISALGTSYHDAVIQRWDLALFGTQPAHTLAGQARSTWLSELLHAGYVAYYPAIF